MNCPECDHDKSACVDSRSNKTYTRRRRKCLKCGHKWTTNEVDVGLADQLRTGNGWTVVDRDKAVKERAIQMILNVLNQL
jgi:transcriptional regulator NrdR family protein